MPDYSLVDLQKYGNRVLLQRIVQLVLAVENARADWAGAFVHGTESLHGELPMCVEALSRLRRIRTQYAGQEPPLVPSGTVSYLSLSSLRH